jgi:hypothetical protein
MIIYFFTPSQQREWINKDGMGLLQVPELLGGAPGDSWRTLAQVVQSSPALEQLGSARSPLLKLLMIQIMIAPVLQESRPPATDPV